MDDEIDLSQLKLAIEWINLTDSLRDGRALPNKAYWEALVAATLATRRTLPKGQAIFRARLMPPERELDAEAFAPSEMGPPPPDKAKALRLNPDGVPRFYGAFERDTAIAEMRAWRKARISIGRFSTTVDLAVADLTSNDSTAACSESIHWLSFMLGRPVHDDDHDSYLASQRIAAECQASGLHGILYDSALNPDGVNIALFGANDVVCGATELYEVTGLSYTSQRLSP